MPASSAAAQKLAKCAACSPSPRGVASSKAKFSPKMAGQHRGRRRRLRAVAAGIFGEGRRDQQRLPFRVDQPADVGDRPHQVVFELGVPAADEGIGQRDAEPRQDVDALVEAAPVALEDLQGDRDPVAGGVGDSIGSSDQKRAIGALLGRQVLPGLVDLERLLVEGRSLVLAVGGRRRQRAGGAVGMAKVRFLPQSGSSGNCCCAIRLVGTQCAGPWRQLVFAAGSPCSRRPRRHRPATRRGCARRPPCHRPRCAPRHRPDDAVAIRRARSFALHARPWRAGRWGRYCRRSSRTRMRQRGLDDDRIVIGLARLRAAARRAGRSAGRPAMQLVRAARRPPRRR